MTFEQFYQEVTKQSGVNADRKYVRILWDMTERITKNFG